MYCFHCGKNISDRAIVCANCGAKVNPVLPPREGSVQHDDSPLNPYLSLACFLQPMLGMILYFMWKSVSPTRAKAALKWSVIGVSIQFAVLAIVMVYVISFMSVFNITYPL
ncbi:MAG: zinc ribbon domain-containing protein [Candidatus Cloacimonadaceae bacterium]